MASPQTMCICQLPHFILRRLRFFSYHRPFSECVCVFVCFPPPRHEHNAVNHLCSTLSNCTNVGSFSSEKFPSHFYMPQSIITGQSVSVHHTQLTIKCCMKPKPHFSFTTFKPPNYSQVLEELLMLCVSSCQQYHVNSSWNFLNQYNSSICYKY
jgi:hypothetical protein